MPVQAADPAIEALRIAQQKQLDALQAEYHAKVRGNPNLVKPDGTIDTSHPDYQKTLSEYVQAKGQIQSTFSGQDPRGKELEAIMKAHGKDVDPTGSAPKDVRADMDITAKTTKTADAIVATWKANGDDVVYDPEAWHPCQQDQGRHPLGTADQGTTGGQVELLRLLRHAWRQEGDRGEGRRGHQRQGGVRPRQREEIHPRRRGPGEVADAAGRLE